MADSNTAHESRTRGVSGVYDSPDTMTELACLGEREFRFWCQGLGPI